MPYGHYAFILIDLLNAILICSIVHSAINYLKRLDSVNLRAGKYKKLIEESSKNTCKFILTDETFDSDYWSLAALTIYCFNPFTLASCLASSTVVVHNLMLLSWLWCLLGGYYVFAFGFLALHANISVYTVMLGWVSVCFIVQKSGWVDREEVKETVVSPELNTIIW